MKVKVWSEQVMIPTYETGKPEKNPMFWENRVYQGSSGVVYPYPVVEKVGHTRVERSYCGLYLENEYLKVMILPELGGRVQMAYDKIRERHFVYYNEVIKPALVGLTGPWISGGIEFNWPQHHRPSTFLPVDYTLEELEDGGARVWIHERERLFHQRALVGFTLRPGMAFLEVRVWVSNPTPLPQTFLWWANPALAADDDYQSVFPTDVNAVFDHGRRDVSAFPIARGIYYKVDYSSGVDISWYKNLPVPTSYMAIRSEYDFVGGYDSKGKAGMLHVADHYISPGKKQWTWGCGDFGKAWERNLTDSNGPYVELMAGVYTDNQPDFAWLQPYEEKEFVQYFIPYRELGVVKNASPDLLINVEQEGGEVVVKVFATSRQPGMKVCLEISGKCIWEELADLTPECVYERRVAGTIENWYEVRLLVVAPETGRTVISWQGEKTAGSGSPEAAQTVGEPEQIGTSEELFLLGQHLEQYRHATFAAEDYYREALKRDAGDVRNNNALGVWLLRRGQFRQAEEHFRRAIAHQTRLNGNPYDGEVYYHLGVCLKFQGKTEEAYAAFGKACWNGGVRDAAGLGMAQLSVVRLDFVRALEEINYALGRNTGNLPGRHLKGAILRHLGRQAEAMAWNRESLGSDKFNFGCLYEQYLLSHDEEIKDSLIRLMRKDSHNYEEVALDYLNAGLYRECMDFLMMAEENGVEVSPLVDYYRGYAAVLSGMEGKEMFRSARQRKPDYCFPNRLEAIGALQAGIGCCPDDAKAWYYLGNLWYDKRQYPEAIDCWEKSMAIDPSFGTVKRNLALAYYNKCHKPQEAVRLLEEAFDSDQEDARLLMELDQLYKRMHYPHRQRLEFLMRYDRLVEMRDDLYLERITLLNILGDYTEAARLLATRRFNPWEGGEGKVPEQYQWTRMGLAETAMDAGDYAEVLNQLKEGLVYPDNLGEGKLYNAQENDYYYYMGLACREMRDEVRALEYFSRASWGKNQPAEARYYNDQKPDKIFYRGLALRELGIGLGAQECFQCLVDYGEQHYCDRVKLDYFAVSLPDLQIWNDDLDRRNRTHCCYMMGLGYWGLGEEEKALHFLGKALEEDSNHQGALWHKRKLDDKLNRGKRV